MKSNSSLCLKRLGLAIVLFVFTVAISGSLTGCASAQKSPPTPESIQSTDKPDSSEEKEDEEFERYREMHRFMWDNRGNSGAHR